VERKIDIEKLKPWMSENYFKNKTVVVTGGCGFLGSWICTTILKMGGRVFCVDNLSTGITLNLDELKKNENFIFINKDIQKLSLTELPKNANIVLHFASRASPDDYRNHPIDTLESNSIGTKNLLEYSIKNQSLFLFASTSEIYGEPSVVPTPETYYGYVNTMGQRSCYDEGKRYAESLIHAYHQTYGIEVRVARIFNTYGPGLRPEGDYGRAMSRFILQGLKNEPITIYGDGSQTRSFNYITDTLTGIMSILANKSFNVKPVNIGNSKEIKILDLANMIKKITKSKSKIVFLPPHSDDPKRRCPDTTRLREIGWKPLVSLEEGLKTTIEWIRKNYV